MTIPSEKLAQSLEVLKTLQNKNGITVIKSSDLSRTHRDRLIANGFICEVIKGWYISTRPEVQDGDSTSWFTSFWYFVSIYFKDRFGEDWCLSPEQSLLIHSGNQSVPSQLIVRSPKAKNNKIKLLHGTSFFDFISSLPSENEIVEKDGLNLYSLSAALLFCSPDYFIRKSIDARTALSMIKDSSEILPKLLDGGHTTIAGRLAGAFRNIRRDRIADDIIKTMKRAGYDVRESDPFKDKLPAILDLRETSPYVNRLKLMWRQMRQTVVDNFPEPPGMPGNIISYLKQVEDTYTTDAYNSLSIEGYRISPGLIEKVRKGNWNPDDNENDREQQNLMAARGYWLAFQAVKKSIKDILSGKNPGHVAYTGHGHWYRELFAPSVNIGILKASDLAGYRNDQVFIKGSMHAPLKPDAIRDAMPAFFDMLKEETEPCVRAVLGHFIFVYIHPYMDGNGRIGRFLMNAMLASGGYKWTIIPIKRRNEYMSSLEKASIEQDILPFTRFVAKQVKANG